MSTAIEIENDVENGIDAEPVRRRFSVEEFQRMGEAGIIAPDERVELIDGEVYEMTPVGPRHIWSVIYLNKYFTSFVADDLFVAPQCGVVVGESQLRPDFALLRLRSGKHPGEVPQPEDCILLVEVADSSTDFDRESKRRMYAEASIPEYWVLDLPAQTVVVHLEPVSGDYRKVTEYRRHTAFSSPALGGREVRADDLLEPISGAQA